MSRFIVFGFGAVVTAGIAAGCAVDIPREHRTEDLVPPDRSAVNLHEVYPATMLVVNEGRHAALDKPVSVNMSGVPLRQLFMVAAPDLTVVPDDIGVDLSQRVSVRLTGGTLGQLLDYLSKASPYAYDLQGQQVHIASRVSQSWNLVALATQRQSSGTVGSQQTGTSSGGGGVGVAAGGGFGGAAGGGVGGGAAGLGGGSGGDEEEQRGVETTVHQNEDEWTAVVNTARAILGIPAVATSAGGGGGEGDAEFTDTAAAAAGVSEDGLATLVAIRSLGLIRATGAPRDMRRLDAWFTRLQKSSTQQIHLDVKALEVTLEDTRARGINWQALIEASIEGVNFDGLIGIAAPVDTSAFTNPAAITGAITGVDSDGGETVFTAVLAFLSQYGDVKLLNEPNVTVTNGRTANFTTGIEFSYVATIQQTVVEGGTVTVTPTIARILVGVKLAVTPRLLPDNRILIDVVPVITSLRGFDQFVVAGNTFSNPNIALNELATQVITKPGRPIHIGGLISSRFENALTSLPTDFSIPGLKWLFSSEQNELDRRELVIMITPTLVEA